MQEPNSQEHVTYFRQPTQTTKRVFQVAILIAVSPLAFAACLTPTPTRNPVPSLATSEQQTQGTAESSTGQKKMHQILTSVQSVELSFARGNCPAVMRSAQALLQSLAADETESLPLSIRLAMSICASKLSPTHPDQAEAALSYADEALRQLPPLWSTSFLLSLKAERFEAMGRYAEARSVRESIARELDSDQRIREKNDLALLRLQDSYSKLTAAEQDLLRRFVSRSSAEGQHFAVLSDLETAAAQNPNDAFTYLLQRIRDQLILRIESAYAKESAKLVAALQLGRSAEAEAIEERILQDFPTLSFKRRTKALANAFTTGGTIPLEGAASETAQSGSGGWVTEEERLQAARKALDSGRPDQAVGILKAIPPHNRDGSVTQLLSEAETVHIRELRLRVRDLFKRAETRGSSADKISDYEQCLEILRYTLKEYPNTQHRRSLERNIRSVEERLSDLKF